MTRTIAALFFFAALVSFAFAAQPKVIKFEPDEGATVAAGVAELKLTFDRPMKETFAVRQARAMEGAFPILLKTEPCWTNGGRTFVQKVHLEADKQYGIALNTILGDTFEGFISTSGEVLPPLLWTFRTGKVGEVLPTSEAVPVAVPATDESAEMSKLRQENEKLRQELAALKTENEMLKLKNGEFVTLTTMCVSSTHGGFCPGETVTNYRNMPDSVWAHAPSKYVYNLDKKWKTFKVGIGWYFEKQESVGSANFIIKGDGKVLYKANRNRWNPEHTKIFFVDIDVSKIRQLELIVDDMGNKHNAAAVWFSPTVSK
jgi:hypothetical protein